MSRSTTISACNWPCVNLSHKNKLQPPLSPYILFVLCFLETTITKCKVSSWAWYIKLFCKISTFYSSNGILKSLFDQASLTPWYPFLGFWKKASVFADFVNLLVLHFVNSWSTTTVWFTRWATNQVVFKEAVFFKICSFFQIDKHPNVELP